MPSTITAEVHAVVYHNPDNGYAVVRVRAKDEPGMLTVVGCLGQLQPGEYLEITGEWKNHPKFGRQMEATSFKQTYPATEHGVVRFLKSSLKGVGEKTAKELVERFGVAVLDLLDNDPEKLLGKGISRKKLAGMLESWQGQREVKSLIVFLHSNEVPPTYASRIFKIFGAQSEAKLRENPYELAYLIRGIGFRTADNMALKLGFAEDSPQRIEAAIAYILVSQGERGGHMFCPKDRLLTEAGKLLDVHDPELLEEGLATLEGRKRVHIEDLPEQGVSQAVFLMTSYRAEREISQRLFGLVNHPAPVSEAKVRQTLPIIEGSLGFKLSDEQRLAVLNACVHKVFIITGGPGTGKTTITNLINRFYDIEEGTITFDGINVKSIRKDDLRKSLGMVLQDTHLFTGTVMDNLRYGRLDASDEDCIQAAKQASAHSFIKRLPQGYDTMITSDGTNLSQGQRQLLAIARAAVADPPVLILDEATSSIDTRTERLIEKGMDALMKGRTVFVIAHRLSTVRNANAIIVLEHGEIIERGDHDDLLRQKGRYYRLCTGQYELA